MSVPLAILLGCCAIVLAWLAVVRPPLPGSRTRARAVIATSGDGTTTDADGAVRSLQSADITLPGEVLATIWTPSHLERLARTYWRFLTRFTLGLVRIVYDEDERAVVFVTRPFVLLRFLAPEYAMDGERALVRWRIADGLLVSKAGHGGDGYLEIDVRREQPPGSQKAAPDTKTRVHVSVEVANFYPSLASGVATWFYANTQARVHVIVTHSFLRSLARMDLAHSRVGRLARATDDDDLPAPREGDARRREHTPVS
jgi:hypothetical protein